MYKTEIGDKEAVEWKIRENVEWECVEAINFQRALSDQGFVTEMENIYFVTSLLGSRREGWRGNEGRQSEPRARPEVLALVGEGSVQGGNEARRVVGAEDDLFCHWPVAGSPTSWHSFAGGGCPSGFRK